MSKSNRFESLTAAIKGEVDLPVAAEPEVEIAPAPVPSKRGRAKGKRSNPDYEQVGAYIPKSLSLKVKRLLLEEPIDFSELVAELLQEWIDGKSLK